MTSRPPRVEMILIAEITVANPRMRNPKIHKTITESIEQRAKGRLSLASFLSER